MSLNKAILCLQSIGGFTWPGIEHGEPPRFKHSFFEVRKTLHVLTLTETFPLTHSIVCNSRVTLLGCLIRSMWQYIDALRFGNLERFKDIEEEAGDWWFPTLDRGAGAALHFAAESGQVTTTSCNAPLSFKAQFISFGT